jgi:tRNA G46 methylase TrmB
MDIFSLKVEKEYFHISSNLDKNNTSFIYGEVCCKNLSEILLELELNDRLFLDIGSGCGKIVLYLAIKLNMNSEGIEIDKNRFDKSIEFLNKLNLLDNVTFYNESFKKVYLGNYDVIYCCNLVFSDEDNKILYKKIIKEFKGISILFDYDDVLSRFLIKKYNVKTSWSKYQIVYIFNIF